MQRVYSLLVLGAVALTGCTTTESHPDYGTSGYYDRGYPPGYAGTGPTYVQPGYGQPVYVAPPPPPRPGYYPQPGYAGGPDYRRPDEYRRDERPREEYRTPAPPINREAVEAGDQLTEALDRYQRSINRYNDPQVNNMKAIISQFRGAAEQWRSGAHAGGARQTLQASAQDLLNRFNAANQLYAQMVATSATWKSNDFARVATATERVVNSVR